MAWYDQQADGEARDAKFGLVSPADASRAVAFSFGASAPSEESLDTVHAPSEAADEQARPSFTQEDIDRAYREGFEEARAQLEDPVAEQLVEELFYREGIVGSEKAKERTRSATISKRRFKDMRAGERILFLQEQKVLQPFLAERLEQGRQTRNNLMHKGRPVLPRDAGSYLTALRDLWALFLSSEF